MKHRLQKRPYRVHLALWVDYCRLAIAFTNVSVALCVQYWREWSSNKRSNMFVTEFNARVNWNRPTTRAGADPASTFYGLRFQTWLWQSRYRLTTVSRMKYTSQQNNGRQNGLISQMLFSEMQKNMVKKVTFLGFRGGDRPNPPLDPPLNQGGGQTGLSKPLTEFLYIILDFQKNVMLICVSCETPEQITDYFYFKLRSLFLHGSIYSR